MQRLSLAKLKVWEEFKYGMFISFGMSTFDADEFSKGDRPSSFYAPDQLDVGQWVSVARDAGMKYAVLTAKHVAGHCLWPSKHTDYHVGTSGNTTDVVEAFVVACNQRGVKPCLYYCSWDNHHKFGSQTPTDVIGLPRDQQAATKPFTTREYQDFQMRQLEELLTNYGSIFEVWIDIPIVLPRACRNDLYRQIAAWQPESVIMMNHGVGNASTFNVDKAWPTDLIAMERSLPDGATGFVPWRTIEGKTYYMPGEVSDCLGREWFYVENDVPRSDAELLGMYLTSTSRQANFLLSVGPDRHGLIPARYSESLMRLRKNIDRL
ncbi:MAG: alpha-L-fucosidase [Terrimicrobiaceae bacterium]